MTGQRMTGTGTGMAATRRIGAGAEPAGRSHEDRPAGRLRLQRRPCGRPGRRGADPRREAWTRTEYGRDATGVQLPKQHFDLDQDKTEPTGRAA